MNRIPQTILKGVCPEPDSARKKITSGWVHFRLHSSQLNNNQEITKVPLRKEVSLKSKKKLENWKKAWKFVIVGRDLGVSVTEQQFGQMPWASSYWGDSTGGNTETHISGVCKWARGMLFHQSVAWQIVRTYIKLDNPYLRQQLWVSMGNLSKSEGTWCGCRRHHTCLLNRSSRGVMGDKEENTAKVAVWKNVESNRERQVSF